MLRKGNIVGMAEVRGKGRERDRGRKEGRWTGMKKGEGEREGGKVRERNLSPVRWPRGCTQRSCILTLISTLGEMDV